MIDPRQIIAGLIARGVPEHAAVALAGNMAVESGFDPGINEINPLVEGSRGGFGLIQWTGPRRRALEQYAGGNVADLDTQLDFLVHELNTSERRARDRIYGAENPLAAARSVSNDFLRPGIPHLDRRIAETRRLMGQETPPNALNQPVRQPENALAAYSRPNPLADLQAPRVNRLDPSIFLSRTA